MTIVAKSGRFWLLLWGGVVLGLVVVLVLEHQFGRSTVGEGARPPAKVVEAKLLPPFQLTPEQQAGAETTARPLFVPARRPSPTVANVGPVAVKRGQFILQGTMVVGALSIAMLKEVSTGTIHRIEKGGEILGMALAEVSAEQVVLKVGGDSETLPLLVARGVGAAAAAAEHGPFGSAGSVAGPAVAGPAGAGNAGAGNAPQGVPAARAGTAPVGHASPNPVPAAPGTARVHAGALSGPIPGTTADSAAMTPEAIIARRRAARNP